MDARSNIVPQQFTRKQIYEACRHNRPLFAQYFFPHHVHPNIGVPLFHKEIYKSLADRSNEFVLIIAPRGFAKTTVALTISTLHDIAYNLERCIVLISETAEKAVRDLSVIAYELRFNEKFRAVYGDLTTSNKWTLKEFVTRNGIYVVARGSGMQLRGLKHPYGSSRPTKILLDDPESLKTNAATPEQRRKTKDWFDGDVCYMVARGSESQLQGIVRVIGTVIHHDCLIENLKRYDSRFTEKGKIFFYQAIVEKNGREQSLWPEYYSLDFLKDGKRRAEKDGNIAAWWSEMMNIPASEESGFTQSDLRLWDGIFLHQDGRSLIQWGTLHIPVETTTCVDLASSEEPGAAFNVVMTYGMDSEKNCYIIEYKKWHEENPTTVLLELIRQCMIYHPHTLGIEINAYQKTFKTNFEMIIDDKNILRAIMENKNYDYSERKIMEFLLTEIPFICEIRQTGSKIPRIQSLRPKFRAGMIHHMSHMEDFLREYREFPKGKTVDVLDVLQMCDSCSRPATLPSAATQQFQLPGDDVVEYVGDELYTEKVDALML